MQPGCWDFDLSEVQSAAPPQSMLVCGPQKLGLAAWPAAAAACMRTASGPAALSHAYVTRVHVLQPQLTSDDGAASPAAGAAAPAAADTSSSDSSDEDVDVTIRRMTGSLQMVRECMRLENELLPAAASRGRTRV